MSHLLIGNGLIIQYGGTDYLNANIVNRALTNIRVGRFPRHLYPRECADLVGALARELTRILNGHYDNLTTTTYDRSALQSLKRRYPSDLAYTPSEIGFEDYFLIFELVHNHLSIGNPDRFISRGVLRRMFLDAIFNDGQIEDVHRVFPSGLVNWLAEHEEVFTTNYDSNLEAASGIQIRHLHGSFKTLSETYDLTSFRNQLGEDLLDGERVDAAYPHLYSNCIVSYTGAMKIYAMGQSALANRAMEKMAEAYRRDPRLRRQIENMPEDNELIRRLKKAIRLKVKQPQLRHQEQYPSRLLEKIEGTLEVVGLSPHNDLHLFEQLTQNARLTEIVFHYFAPEEAPDAESLLAPKPVRVVDVRELWDELGA